MRYIPVGSISDRRLATLMMVGGVSLASAGLAFSWQALLARSLGPSDYAGIALAIASVNLFGGLVTLGANQIVLREVSRGRITAETVQFSLRATASGLTLASTSAAGMLVFSEARDFVALWILATSGLLVAGTLDLCRAQAEGALKFGRTAGLGLLVPVLRLAAALAILALPSADLDTLVAGLALVNLGAGVALTLLYRRSLQRPPPGQREAGAHRGDALLFSIDAVLFDLLFRSILFIVARMMSPEDTGLLAVALMVTTLGDLVISTSVSRVALPLLYRSSLGERDQLRGDGRLIILLSCAGSVALSALAYISIPLVFGAEFAGAQPLAAVLALAIPVRTASTLKGAVLVSHDMLRRKVTALILSVSIAVPASVPVVQLFGLGGAVLAVLIAEGLLLASYALVTRAPKAAARQRQWSGQ